MASKVQPTDSPYIDANLRLEPTTADGNLTGLTFAVKDMYDVRGEKTSFGNPSWYDSHPPAESTAPCIQVCLDAGATMIGKTHMDELAYSLNGENYHYGTPKNPAAPDRIPGGSSSGSASAVASGDVDFALGSDTGGSVRVPASFCGILGIRPTHGRVSMEGSAPLGKSFDTCGWFAKDPKVLQRAGNTLLNKSTKKSYSFKRWLVGSDVFALADKDVQNTLFQAVKSNRGKFDSAFGTMTETVVDPEDAGLGSLEDWYTVFRTIQAAEAWRDLGKWVEKEKPVFGPGTKERFEGAAKITKETWNDADEKRAAITSHVTKLLGDDAVLIIPTSPGPAPKLNLDQNNLNIFRTRLLSMTCIAGNSRLPQINIPCGLAEGAPIGLSIVGPSGSDEELLEVVTKLFPLV